MKHLPIAAALAAIITATSAMAEMPGNGYGPPNRGSTSTNIQGQAQGQLQGQQQRQGQRQSMSGGNVTVNDRLQAPAVSAPGFSSGHPCGFAPASFGLSIVGGALSAGGQRSDDACLLAQMGYKDAAVLMIADRNQAARDALVRAGNIAPTAPAVSSRSAEPAAYTSCEHVDGAIRVGVKRGAGDAVKARAVAECKAALR